MSSQILQVVTGIAGLVGAGCAFTLGMALTCKVTGWMPVNVHIHTPKGGDTEVTFRNQ
jgi:hypothetical protein